MEVKRKRSKSIESEVPLILNKLPDQREFYNSSIQKRLPAVLRNQCHNVLKGECGDNATSPLFTRSQLETIAGDAIVEIEVRDPDSPASPDGEKGTPPAFGHGNMSKLTITNFLQKLNDTSDGNRYYLATQSLNSDLEERPEVLSNPVRQLMSHNHNDGTKLLPPQAPELMGNLVPMNVNCWMGRCDSKNGTSSRFHHDYHDNLYLLLKGKKRFRVASPNNAKLLPTDGTVEKVYPNGRISYQGHEVREDGAPLEAAELLKLSLRMREIQRLMEAPETDGEKSMEELEMELEEVMERQLDIEMGNENASFPNDDDDDDSPEKEAFHFEDENSDCEDEDFEDEEEASGSSEDVLNFCKFDSFEAEKRGVQIHDIEIQAGDMLYLPAGWYHEVFSSSAALPNEDSMDAKEDDGLHENVHLALNYWFFPPNTDKASFEHPYEDEFWEQTIFGDKEDRSLL